jgi:NAD(P)-dependent dehydrogenase (short-subunit alcohol dehydrogenase family)
MSDKTIAVVGAGPGLGFAIARRFGREGFRVALISRNQKQLEQLTGRLASDGITAAGFVGDVTKEATVAQAFREIGRRFGQIDVLEYSPVSIPADPAGYARLNATTMTPATVQEAFAVTALGAVTSVGQVLPQMLERRAGTILITTGISAKAFMPAIGAWGMAGAAVRNYARTLHVAVRDQGVFVATVCLGVQIKEGDPFGDPHTLAETHFSLYRDRDRPEVFINHLPPGWVAELDGDAYSK